MTIVAGIPSGTNTIIIRSRQRTYLLAIGRIDMHAPHLPPRKVRIGIVGVGNCASSLVQGLSYYKEAKSNEPVSGLMNASVGGYHVSDIEVTAAFDVNAAKVGKDVAEALWESPNNPHRFAEVAPIGVTVQRGRTLDGIGQYL